MSTDSEHGDDVPMHTTQVGLPARSSTPRIARKLVYDAGERSGFPARLINDAAQVAGELVSSSIQQMRSRVDIAVRFEAGQVTVRVRDHGTTPPLLGRDTRTGPARSTAIIERLCSSWGYCSTETGREVWALLRLQQAPV